MPRPGKISPPSPSSDVEATEEMSPPSSLNDDEASNNFGGRRLSATKVKQKSSYKSLRVKKRKGSEASKRHARLTSKEI